MATQLIDFEVGSPTTGDSGERNDADAIKPIDPGERVQAAVIGRPPENLRARTEELRKKVEELLYRADADKWIIHGGNSIGEAMGTTAFPAVQWNHVAGTFKVTEDLDFGSASVDLVIEPLMGPETDHFDSREYIFGGAATFTFEATSGESLEYDYQLANSLRVIWDEKTAVEMGVGVFCTAVLGGNPEHILRITIRDDGSTQASHVQTALNTVISPPIVNAPISYTFAGAGATPMLLADVAGFEDVTFTGTYSRELHHLTAVELATFFAAPGNELLLDGDGIGIWYEELIDSTLSDRGGRRQATPTTEDGGGIAPNTDVPSSKLFKFSVQPERIPGAIPLCRRVGTHIAFVDGTIVPPGLVPTRFRSVQAELVESREISPHLTGSPTVTSLTAGTVTTQLEEVAGYLGRRTSAELEEKIQEDWSFVKNDGVTTFWNQIFANSIAGGSGTSGIDLRYGSFGDFKFGPWGGVSSYGSTGQSFSGPGISLGLGVPSVDRIVEILYCSYATGPSTLRRRLCVVYNASSAPRLAIYDLDTININSMTAILDEALTGYLPVGPSWLAIAADSCDSSVYVAFTDGAGTSRIQAFDISADPVPAITSSWGAEGINPGVDCVLDSDVIPYGQNGTKGGIKVVSEDYIFVVHGELLAASGFLLLSRLDGSIVSTGPGNAPTATKAIRATGAIASDGERVYFGYVSYETVGPTYYTIAEVGYAVLPDLTTVDGNPIRLITRAEEGEGTLLANAQSVAALCFDGECLWALSTFGLTAPAPFVSRLWRISWDIAGDPHAGVFPGRPESSTVLEVPDGNILNIMVREEVTTIVSNMMFDGVSLWFSGAQNVTTNLPADQYINYDTTTLTHFLTAHPYGTLRPVLLKLDVLNANLTLGRSFVVESKVFDCASFRSQELGFNATTNFRDLIAFDGDTLWHSCSAINALSGSSLKGKVNGLRRAVFR